jgi:hypothetical protein
MVRFAALLAVCASAVSALSLFETVHFDNVDAILLEKRQTGDPQFDCHANCGYAIRGARQPEYCGNATWIAWYDGCMECAVAANIWSMYGNSVSSAAQACGLSGVPIGLAGGNATESAAPSGSASASISDAASSASAIASSVTGSVASAAASASASASEAVVSAVSAHHYINSKPS